MAKDLPAVLRIKSSATNEADFVLVHLESTGSRPLDIKLVGTDEDAAFTVSCKIATDRPVVRWAALDPPNSCVNAGANFNFLNLLVKHNRITSYKSKNAPCSDEEWISILTSVLLGESVEGGQEDVTRGVEIHAKVEDSTMTLVIQKQRLGAIKLTEDADAAETISLYNWCALTIKASDVSKMELEQLRLRCKEQQESLEKLNENFKEITKAKADHETQLLEKFSLLLNEKKLKIRDQQRLLSGAKVDPEKLKALEASRTGKSRTAGASRSGKRKAAKDAEIGSSDESDDGFEKMDIDKDQEQEQEQESDDSDKDEQQTPEPSDNDETASEDEEPEPPKRTRASTRKKAVKESSSEEKLPAKTASRELPPRRDLPFVNKPTVKPSAKPTAPPSPPPAGDDGSATESGSDDEL